MSNEHASEKNAGRYVEVRLPLTSSNVRAAVLIACRECGTYVFNKHAHDAYHRVRASVLPPAKCACPSAEVENGTCVLCGKPFLVGGGV